MRLYTIKTYNYNTFNLLQISIKLVTVNCELKVRVNAVHFKICQNDIMNCVVLVLWGCKVY